MRHLISITDLSVQDIDELLCVGQDIINHPAKYAHAAEGKKLATLFFEPSTRTRLSFEAAMYELGGHVIGFSSANSSSAAKGESVSDTISMAGCYVDIVAMRHPLEGAPLAGIRRAAVPVINAGDGGHQHPTQTLTDLLTLKCEKGRLDHLTIGLCGDLKFGRTVHSLIEAMSRYEGIAFVLISPKELRVPAHILKELDEKHIPYREVESLEEEIGQLDALYMTRIQRERFFDENEYLRLKDSYVLDPAKMALAKEDMIVMHPLPRVNEISTDVDDDPRACYFKQAWYGKIIRMALILKLLGEKDKEYVSGVQDERIEGTYQCKNPRCITQVEQGIKHVFLKSADGEIRCMYCEHGLEK